MLKTIKNLLSKLFSKIPLPITLKVTMWYGIFLTAVFAAIIGSLFLLSDNITEYTTRELLMESVNNAARTRREIKGFYDGVFISKYNPEGRLSMGTGHPDFPSTAEYSGGAVIKAEYNNRKFLYYDKPISQSNTSEDGWIRGTISLDTAHLISGGALILISIILPIVLIFVIYIGYRIIKRAFKPVENISNLAVEIGRKNDLSKRIDIGRNKDEIQKMSIAFNSMLDGLESASLKEKQFTSDVSHELRTPVSVIKAESEYALEFGDSIEDMKESVEIINKQAGKMTDMINQLLNISRMDRMENIEKKNINLSELMNSIAEEQKLITSKENINLIIDIEKNIMIQGDELLIHRAVNNLFSNAVKFTENEIVFTVKKINKLPERFTKPVINNAKTSNRNLMSNEWCEIVVKDNGPGISEEYHDKIWDRFFQTDESRTKKRNDGSGLGLSIVKQIIDIHNGYVSLNSDIGQGSEFKIFLSILDK